MTTGLGVNRPNSLRPRGGESPPQLAPALLTARGLAKTYEKEEQRIAVLAGVNLTIWTHETLAIVGGSGAGKSTLLHVLGTLDRPDEGSIVYEGTDLGALSPQALCEFRNRTLGFVFQFHYLLGEFSALENVMIPCLIQRLSRAEASRRAEVALEEVGLSHRLRHRPHELSGGEQQRVALARALVLNPALILADEVTGNLDAQKADEIHQLILKLNQSRGTTFVIVTHNMVLARALSRTVILRDGKVWKE